MLLILIIFFFSLLVHLKTDFGKVLRLCTHSLYLQSISQIKLQTHCLKIYGFLFHLSTIEKYIINIITFYLALVLVNDAFGTTLTA
jgi:hypothetical protein